MSDEEIKGGAQDDNGGAGVSLEELQKEIESLKAKNTELMDETKAKSKRLKAIDDEKSKLEEQRLKEEGNLKELLEREQKKNSELAMRYKTDLMDTQLEKAAIKAGCKDFNAFKSLVGDYSEAVSFDENFRADNESLNSFISEHKEKWKHLSLFESDVKPPQDAGASNQTKEPPKDFVGQGKSAFAALRGEA